MTAPRHIAVIDIGKTNAKLVLIDRLTGAQLAGLSRPNTVLSDGFYPHADVEGLWAFILEGLRTLAAYHRVEAVSITTHGATAALLAGERLALPVLDYEFDGPDETAADYAAARPPFNRTLSPPLPNGLNLGRQLFWQSRRFAAQWAQVTAILTYPQYWAWRLTGTLASEATSLGCHTDLWQPDNGTFSSLVDGQGWTALFPPLQPAASVIGAVRPEVTARTGLPPDTPVSCGIHDSNASLLPHLNAHEAPFTIISSGTWVIAMTVGGSIGALDPARDSLANVDALGRPVPTARFMGGREFDLLARNTAPATEADIAAVLRDNLAVHPSIVPGVGPFPNRQSGWTIDPDTRSPGERLAAVSLYLALMTQAALGLCGVGRSVIVEGPLARNGLYGRALQQLLHVPVQLSGDATGTSHGASLLFGAAGQPGTPEVADPTPLPGLGAYAAAWQAAVTSP